MQVRCPECRREIDAGDVNVSADTAFCAACSQVLRLSRLLAAAEAERIDLGNPPRGAWLEEGFDGFTVGASTRSPWAFFLVPFMCVWSGGALGGIYGSQIARGQFNLFLSLFGIPFILGSIYFWSHALMHVCGKVTVVVRQGDGEVFVGVGPFGRRRRFDWSDVSTVGETTVAGRRGAGRTVVLEGRKRITFGSLLSEERRYFLVQALRKMLAER